MSKPALSGRPGSAFSDLPPTLQPHVVRASAPPVDRWRTALLSGLIYALLGGGAFGILSVPPGGLPAPPRPLPEGRTVVIEGPLPARPSVELHSQTAQAGLPGPVLPGVLPAGPGPGPEAGSVREATDGGDLALPGLLPGGGGPGLTGNASTVPGGGGVLDLGFKGLGILHQVDPLYPEMARRARMQGQVLLRMAVDEQGRPTQVEVLEGPVVFHASALQAARQWRFEPARLEGRPVPASFQLTLKFSLR